MDDTQKLLLKHGHRAVLFDPSIDPDKATVSDLPTHSQLIDRCIRDLGQQRIPQPEQVGQGKVLSRSDQEPAQRIKGRSEVNLD